MAEKKASIPTFDFNKRQRTTRLDLLAESQATGEGDHDEVAEPEQSPQVEQPTSPAPAAATFAPVQPTNTPTSDHSNNTRRLDESEATRNRGGRPRATVQKVKKNYQLATTDLENLDTAALELTSKARIRVKDDSSVIGLALAWLRETVENGDQAQLDRLIVLYQAR